MATNQKKTETTEREFGSQAALLAEQLGRLAGTLEGTAESWLNRAALTEQLTKVRDGAAQLLDSLIGGAASGRNTAKQRGMNRSTSPAVDPVRAPGKRHRKPGPTVRGAKKSAQSIPKLRTASAVRQRRKSYA